MVRDDPGLGGLGGVRGGADRAGLPGLREEGRGLVAGPGPGSGPGNGSAARPPFGPREFGPRAFRQRTFASARLDLLPLREEYAPEMARVLADPALYAFTGGAPDAEDGLRNRYRRLVADSPDPAVTWCNWVLRLRAEDRLTGCVQATIAAGRAEIAWVVGTPWQHQGLAKEAVTALVGHLLAEPTPVAAVIAHIHPEHRASAAVATAAGLRATEVRQGGEVRWERRGGL